MRILYSLFFLLILQSFHLKAQQVTISPIPQSITWGAKAFDNSTGYILNGETTADKDAIALIKAKLNTGTSGVEIVIGEKGDSNVESVATEIPTASEGYYLKVETGKVTIAGTDSVGTYYGVQTYLQIASASEVMSVTIKDYPNVIERGLVEGFYGNPFSQSDRIRQFEFYGKNKMNVYIYSPKDDPYHNSQWSVLYPTAQALKMAELVQKAHENKVKFIWAIHLGGKGVTNETEYKKVIAKFEAMYKLGVRDFAIFYDDFGTETDVQQCAATNYIVQNFVNTKKDVGPITFCPTQYNRSWSSGTYLTTLGTQMDKSVRIMWTGNSVVDMINKTDMDWINTQIGRKAYIWLNYPVTDYCIDHILMGPTYGNDLNIATQLGGFTANPMEYAETSKVALYSIADYCWNMTAYNSQASWLRALKTIMPQNESAFKVFCENNIDLGSTYHGLRRDGESLPFKTVADPFMVSFKAGTATVAQADQVAAQLQTFRDAVTELQASTYNPELITEIKPWLQVFDIIGAKGQSMIKMFKALNTKDSVAFIKEYQRIDSLEVVQKSIISRPGTIKATNPKPANEVVAPYLKLFKSLLVAEYKRKFSYMKSIFPAVLIEEGRYFIKYNGAYLTNKIGTTGNPTYVATRDNVNPQRQEWVISIDPTTDRYKLVNAQDLRYVNEIGNFGTNNYDATWNTYNIYRQNDRYAIQNAGSGGDKFWISNTTRVSPGTNNLIKTSNFIFEIIPVSGDTTIYPVITPGASYYIRYNSKYLTKGSTYTTAPTFGTLVSPAAKSQQWQFIVDKSTERYKLVYGSDTLKYVNENGVFGTNNYFSSWNSYVITELGGKISIQNAGDAGTNFWGVNTSNAFFKSSLPRSESYLFEIIPVSTLFPTGIKDIQAKMYSISKTANMLRVNGPDVFELKILSINGSIVRRISARNEINLAGLNNGVYILQIQSTGGKTESAKIIIN